MVGKSARIQPALALTQRMPTGRIEQSVASNLPATVPPSAVIMRASDRLDSVSAAPPPTLPAHLLPGRGRHEAVVGNNSPAQIPTASQLAASFNSTRRKP